MDVPVINGLFVFVLGMLVVFAGMSIIVLFVTLAGKLFTTVKEEKKTQEPVIVDTVVPSSNEDDIPVHVKAAIVAAISAYYFSETKAKCDFVVRKIKRF